MFVWPVTTKVFKIQVWQLNSFDAYRYSFWNCSLVTQIIVIINKGNHIFSVFRNPYTFVLLSFSTKLVETAVRDRLKWRRRRRPNRREAKHGGLANILIKFGNYFDKYIFHRLYKKFLKQLPIQSGILIKVYFFCMRIRR